MDLPGYLITSVDIFLNNSLFFLELMSATSPTGLFLFILVKIYLDIGDQILIIDVASRRNSGVGNNWARRGDI